MPADPTLGLTLSRRPYSSLTFDRRLMDPIAIFFATALATGITIRGYFAGEPLSGINVLAAFLTRLRKQGLFFVNYSIDRESLRFRVCDSVF